MKKRIVSLIMTAALFMTGVVTVYASDVSDPAPVGEAETSAADTTSAESEETTAAQTEPKEPEGEPETEPEKESEKEQESTVTGTLKLYATVKAEDGVEIPKGDEFTFTVSSETDEESASYAVYNEEDDEISEDKGALPLELSLEMGQYALIMLPADTEYTVTQSSHANYVTKDNEKTVTVTEDGIAIAEFTNSYERQYGELAVSVEVVYPSRYEKTEDGTFSFEVAADVKINEVPYYILDSKGETVEEGTTKFPITLDLKDGQTLYAKLPANTVYMVVLEEDLDYEVEDRTRIVSFEKNETAELTFVNKLVEPMGILEIALDIDYPKGPEKPENDVFEFTVDGETYRKDISYTVYDKYGEIAESGVMVLGSTLELADGYYAQLKLPSGYEYTVTQTRSPDYKTEERTFTAKIVKGEISKAVFENEYIAPMGTLRIDVAVTYPEGPEKPEGDKFKFVLEGETYIDVVDYRICLANGTELSSGKMTLNSIIELSEGLYAEVDLPADTVFVVKQKEHPDYTSDKPSDFAQITKNDTVEVIFNNEYKEPIGFLKLSTNVDEPKDVNAPDDTFTYVIKGKTYRDEISYTVYDSVGNEIKSVVAEYSSKNGMTVELKADQYAVIELTPGSYTVIQNEIEDYIIDEFADTDILKNGVSEIIMFNEYVEPLGKLVITREGLGENEAFIFTVKGISDSNSNVWLTVILPVGEESVTVCGLPKGEYEVATVDGWSLRYTVETEDDEEDTARILEVEKNGDVKTVIFSFVSSEKVHWLIGEAYIEKRYYKN